MLPVSCSQFHRLFLADEAVFSVPECHRVKGDTEISAGQWDDTGPVSLGARAPARLW